MDWRVLLIFIINYKKEKREEWKGGYGREMGIIISD